MKREFLESLDIGGGARLPKAAVEAIVAEHGRSVQAAQQAGRVRFTARMADGGEPVTREQIMAIPDRARRRKAIANHLELFEKEN